MSQAVQMVTHLTTKWAEDCVTSLMQPVMVPLCQTAKLALFQAYRLLLLLHSFNGHFSSATWVSWHPKSRTSLDLNEGRGDGWQWHQLDHMLFLTPNQQCQSAECSSFKDMDRLENTAKFVECWDRLGYSRN